MDWPHEWCQAESLYALIQIPEEPLCGFLPEGLSDRLLFTFNRRFLYSSINSIALWEKNRQLLQLFKSVNIAYEANLLLPTVLQKMNEVNILEGSYALARQQIQFKLQKRIL